MKPLAFELLNVFASASSATNLAFCRLNACVLFRMPLRENAKPFVRVPLARRPWLPSSSDKAVRRAPTAAAVLLKGAACPKDIMLAALSQVCRKRTTMLFSVSYGLCRLGGMVDLEPKGLEPKGIEPNWQRTV